MLSQDFLDLLELFDRFSVRYLIVGGHAVSMYTEPRYTKDLDLWLERTPDNARVVLRALHEFGFASTDLSVEDMRNEARQELAEAKGDNGWVGPVERRNLHQDLNALSRTIFAFKHN